MMYNAFRRLDVDDFQALTERIRQFRDARDWKQFHNHKDMAISLVLEASELLEHFQWKKPEEVESGSSPGREALEDELADVAIYLFELADNLGVDLRRAMLAKLEKNGIKYPVEKAKGNIRKYTEL